MKRFLILILFSPFPVFGQSDSCDQYEKILMYFKSDSLFDAYYEGVSHRLKINNKVQKGGIWPDFVSEYIAERTGIERDTSYLDYIKDSSITNPLRRELEQEERFDSSYFIVSCLSNYRVKRNGKINIDFYRKHDDIIVASTYRIFKKPRPIMGLDYLFFFNEKNEIVKVYYAGWLK